MVLKQALIFNYCTLVIWEIESLKETKQSTLRLQLEIALKKQFLERKVLGPKHDGENRTGKSENDFKSRINDCFKSKMNNVFYSRPQYWDVDQRIKSTLIVVNEATSPHREFLLLSIIAQGDRLTMPARTILQLRRSPLRQEVGGVYLKELS
jgi:hypothetical protein